jgi:hypothetical protein
VSIIGWEKIQEGNYFQYEIAVGLVEQPDVRWVVLKRYSDLTDVELKLKSYLRDVALPKIPGKHIITTQTNIAKRA